MLDAVVAGDRVQLPVAASGRDDVGAKTLPDVDRGGADAAGGPVHEQGLALAERRPLHQRMYGCAIGQ